jgi:hypothetical protein
MPEQHLIPSTMMKMMLPPPQPPSTTNPTTRNTHTPAITTTSSSSSAHDGSDAAAAAVAKPLAVAPQNVGTTSTAAATTTTTCFANMPPPLPSPRSTSAAPSNLTRHTSASSVGTFSLFDTQELLHEHLFQSTETTRRDDALLRNLMQTKQDIHNSFASLGTLPSLSSDGSHGVSVPAAAAAAAASVPAVAAKEKDESIPTPVKDAATALVEMTTLSSTTTAESGHRDIASSSAAEAPLATSTSLPTTAVLPTNTCTTSTTASLFNSSTWTKSLQPTHVDVDYGKIFPEQIRPTATTTAAAAAVAAAPASATAPQTKPATDFLNIFLNQLPPPMVPPPPSTTTTTTTTDAANAETLPAPKPLATLVAPPTCSSLCSATMPTTVPTATKAFTPLPMNKSTAASTGTVVVVPMAQASVAVLGPRRAPARATTKRPVAAAAVTDIPEVGPGEIIPFDQVTDRDVLLGRGGRTNHHAGNIRYLAEKEKLQETYLRASKDDKTGIAQQLVDAINKDGGRFLKLWEDPSQVSTLLASAVTTKSSKRGVADSATAQAHSNAATFWFEVDNLTARKKASQTLREINTAENRAAKRAKYTSTSTKKGPR